MFGCTYISFHTAYMPSIVSEIKVLLWAIRKGCVRIFSLQQSSWNEINILYSWEKTYSQPLKSSNYEILTNILEVNFRDNTCRGIIQDKKKGRDWWDSVMPNLAFSLKYLIPLQSCLSTTEGLLRQVHGLATVYWKMLIYPFNLQLESQRRSRAAVTDSHCRYRTIEGWRINTEAFSYTGMLCHQQYKRNLYLPWTWPLGSHRPTTGPAECHQPLKQPFAAPQPRAVCEGVTSQTPLPPHGANPKWCGTWGSQQQHSSSTAATTRVFNSWDGAGMEAAALFSEGKIYVFSLAAEVTVSFWQVSPATPKPLPQ